MTPGRATYDAALPKCDCFRSEGPETRRCAQPMAWHHDRGVWVCTRHPHMEMRPDGSVSIASKGIRDQLMRRPER